MAERFSDQTQRLLDAADRTIEAAQSGTSVDVPKGDPEPKKGIGSAAPQGIDDLR
jgi:hypothetical protein